MGRKRRKKWWPILKKLLVLACIIWLVHEARFYIPQKISPPEGVVPIEVNMKTTSYCHCGKCCSYKWFLFIPYQKTGTMKYRLKHIGVTASGATVRPGSIAADTSIYPFGTIMYIPGYGYGRVEDTGGAIKGQHIDLYRPNHWYARHWGVRSKKVKVWLPSGKGSSCSCNPVDKSEKQFSATELVTSLFNLLSSSVSTNTGDSGALSNTVPVQSEPSESGE